MLGLTRVPHRLRDVLYLRTEIPAGTFDQDLNSRFIDLDHLTHRLLVTHRLLLQCMKKPSILKVRKISDVIRFDCSCTRSTRF